MVKTLLRIYPQAAAEVDMDGLLPIHWALRNTNKVGSEEAVRLLLEAYPDSALSEPLAPGGFGLDYTWTQVIDCLSFSDGLLGRRDTISSAILPIARIWTDGHLDTSNTRHQHTPHFKQTVQDLRSMCPAHQLKKMFFDLLRERVAQLYSQGKKRSTQRKNLQHFTEQYCHSLVGDQPAKEGEERSGIDTADTREAEWLRVGKANPRILSLIKELPAVHTPRLIMMLSQRRTDWVNSLIALTPKDTLVLQEHLPAHLAAAHETESGVGMLQQIIALHPNCLQTRDCVGRTPLHVACANDKGVFAEQAVAIILEHAPETAFTQDHRGMLPVHHACLNSGPAAGSITGRLISIFAPGTQVVDDYGRLPLECALSSSSEGVGEIIKAVVRAFPPAARLLDKQGNNVLHRASLEIQNNPQAPEIIHALLELKCRPNAGALFNYNRQLPLHIASTSTSELAPRCLEMLADAYIPGAWAQESYGETALHLAIRARNLESVRTLTIKSRDKAQHMQNRDNKFPLNLATTRTYREVICQKGGQQNKGGDMFTRRLIDGIGYIWCASSLVGLVTSINDGRVWMVYIEAAFLGSWILFTALSTNMLGTAVEEAGWIGHLLMCIVPTLKSLESFLNIVPLSTIMVYRALWIDNAMLLSNQIVLVSAVVVVSANAIMEDGSRFHALELMPSASYTEIVILFLYRVAECVSRIAVLALALIDILHCRLLRDPLQPCPFRGCLLGNPECEECSCEYKASVIQAIIAEFLFLLIFLRVTATQDNAHSNNAIENLQNHIKIWACSLCNMQGIYLTPPKTMITYLGLKQAETAFIGEVKLLDGLVLLSVRAISNSALLIIYTQVGVRYDLWSEFGSSALLWCAIVAAPVQIAIAYVRYLIWHKIEKRVEMRFKLMSKREQILSSRGKEASTDQMKTLNNSLEMLGKIMEPFNERQRRQKVLIEVNDESKKKHDHAGEPMFWNVTRHAPRLPGDRHVLPLTVPEFVIFSRTNSEDGGSGVDAHGGMGGEDAEGALSPHGGVLLSGGQTGSADEAAGAAMAGNISRRSAIPKKLDLNMLEAAVKWISKAGMVENDTANQIGSIGKSFIVQQAEWSHQLEFIKQGNHVYMDQLMPDGMDFEHHDAFLPLESMSLPAASFSQYARRPWSAEATEAKMVFSWGSSDRRAWQIRESLQSRYAPRRKSQPSAAAPDGRSSAHSKNDKSGPPNSFKVEKIRLLIAELLQVDIVQVQVILMHMGQKGGSSELLASSANLFATAQSEASEEGATRRSRQDDVRNSAELSTPGQSDAVLILGPSSNSLDRRTPEQLLHVLEAAVMDAIRGPKLPPPLSQLVSLTVTKLPHSPFRQDAALTSLHPGTIDLPWLRLPAPKLLLHASASRASPYASMSPEPDSYDNPRDMPPVQERAASATLSSEAGSRISDAQEMAGTFKVPAYSSESLNAAHSMGGRRHAFDAANVQELQSITQPLAQAAYGSDAEESSASEGSEETAREEREYRQQQQQQLYHHLHQHQLTLNQERLHTHARAHEAQRAELVAAQEDARFSLYHTHRPTPAAPSVSTGAEQVRMRSDMCCSVSRRHSGLWLEAGSAKQAERNKLPPASPPPPPRGASLAHAKMA